MTESEQRQWEVISALEKGQERIATILDGVAARMSNVEKKMGESGKGTFAMVGLTVTIMTVVLGIIGTLIAYTYTSNQRDTRQVVVDLAGLVRDHTSDGHPSNMQALIQSNRDLFELELRNQEREIDKMEGRIVHELDRTRDAMTYLQRRTGILFNDGKPY